MKENYNRILLHRQFSHLNNMDDILNYNRYITSYYYFLQSPNSSNLLQEDYFAIHSCCGDPKLIAHFVVVIQNMLRSS